MDKYGFLVLAADLLDVLIDQVVFCLQAEGLDQNCLGAGEHHILACGQHQHILTDHRRGKAVMLHNLHALQVP